MFLFVSDTELAKYLQESNDKTEHSHIISDMESAWVHSSVETILNGVHSIDRRIILLLKEFIPDKQQSLPGEWIL